MNVLLIGGAGFLGRRIIEHLHSEKHAVYVVDDGSVAQTEQFDARAVHIHGYSSEDARTIHHALDQASPEVIFYLAAKQGYSARWSQFGERNVVRAYEFFEHLRNYGASRVRRIVLASSQAVYEPGTDRRENLSPLMPPSAYGLSKLQQEQAFLHMCRWLDIEIVALRYSIILGRGQSMASEESGILRNWYRAFSEGQAPQVYGDGSQMRDFVHVRDAARASVAAMHAEIWEHQTVINIPGFRLPVIEMAHLFQRLTGCKAPAVLGHAVRPGGEFTMTSHGEKALSTLLFSPQIEIKQQVLDFIRGLGFQPQANTERPAQDLAPMRIA